MKTLAWLSTLGAIVLVATSPALTQVTGPLTTFTMAEPIQFTSVVTGPNSGFNAHNNAFRISADGQFRIESFLKNSDGHLHSADGEGTSDNIAGGDEEENHNWAATGGVDNLQGMRLTRVGGGRFNIVSMELRGGVAIGRLLPGDGSTDGTWRLWTGDVPFTGNPNPPAGESPYNSPSANYQLARTFVADIQQKSTIHFGNAYYGVTELFLVDPAAAGAATPQFARNAWDNFVIERLP